MATASWHGPVVGRARNNTYQSPFKAFKTQQQQLQQQQQQQQQQPLASGSSYRLSYAYPTYASLPQQGAPRPPSPPSQRDMDAARQLADLSRGRSSPKADQWTYTPTHAYRPLNEHPYALARPSTASREQSSSSNQGMGFSYNRTPAAPPVAWPSTGHGDAYNLSPTTPAVERQARRLSAMSIDVPVPPTTTAAPAPRGADRISIAALTRQDSDPPQRQRRFSLSGSIFGGNRAPSPAPSMNTSSTGEGSHRRSLSDRFKNPFAPRY
jgi:hypothetical protein